MKLTILLLAPAMTQTLVIAAPSTTKLNQPQARTLKTLQTRQFEGLLSAGTELLLSEIKPFKVENVAPMSKKANAKRVKIYYGPFTLLPANATRSYDPTRMDPAGNNWNLRPTGLPLNAAVLFANTTLQYKDGRIADVRTGVYNHHVAFANMGKFSSAFASCPKSGSSSSFPASMLKTPSVLMGSSEEIGFSSYSTPDGLFNSGYYVGAKDKFVMTGEVVNYTNETKSIYTVSEVEYIEGRPDGMLDTDVVVLNVNQCDNGNLALHPPEGKKKFSFGSPEMTIEKAGYIMSRRGHLHDGGVNIDFRLNGKTICDSKAIYGGEKGSMKSESGQVWETVSGTMECTDPIKVAKGDKISLQANYDLETHPARKHTDGHGMAEEMGVMSFSFAAL